MSAQGGEARELAVALSVALKKCGGSITVTDDVLMTVNGGSLDALRWVYDAATHTHTVSVIGFKPEPPPPPSLDLNRLSVEEVNGRRMLVLDGPYKGSTHNDGPINVGMIAASCGGWTTDSGDLRADCFMRAVYNPAEDGTSPARSIGAQGEFHRPIGALNVVTADPALAVQPTPATVRKRRPSRAANVLKKEG